MSEAYLHQQADQDGHDGGWFIVSSSGLVYVENAADPWEAVRKFAKEMQT